jgi:hypothetical protein
LGAPGRLRQVLWNQLTNAIKFTLKEDAIHVLLERANFHVQLSVVDEIGSVATLGIAVVRFTIHMMISKWRLVLSFSLTCLGSTQCGR